MSAKDKGIVLSVGEAIDLVFKVYKDWKKHFAKK